MKLTAIIPSIGLLFLTATCKNPVASMSAPDFQGEAVTERNDSASKSMVHIEDSSRSYLCTGILIAPDRVLTAGHCAKGILEDRVYRIRTGMKNGRGKIIKAVEEKIHGKITDTLNPDFTFDGDITTATLNDVMILKLESEVTPDSGLEPAKISDIEPKLNEGVMFLAFGAIGEAINRDTNQIEADNSRYLKKGNATIMGHPRLGSSVTHPNNINPEYHLASQNIFAAQMEKNVVEGTEDVQFYTCNGDSGGGVFNSNGELVGIHIAGVDKLVLENGNWKFTRNCESGRGYFLNLHAYKDWLDDKEVVVEDEVAHEEIIEKPAREFEPTFVERNFSVKNLSGKVITKLYASQDYATNYGFNLIKEPLADGGAIHVRMDDKTCYYDFLAVTSKDGVESEYKETINICNQMEWEIKI